jgi:hypothetical protein
MQSVTSIQDAIHKLEVGIGPRILRVVLLVLVIFGTGLVYDLRAYRNFAAPEAMDTAQLARNISEGKGYTTQFIRPLSLFLLQRHNQAKLAGGSVGADTDLALIATNHPDLANPPVYPVVLAGLMKVLPFHYNIETKKSFWSDNGHFQRYQPEFQIAIFNQILLVTIAVMTFFIARKLFDSTVAWISALLVFGCDQLWQFSVSGLSTLLLLVIFLGLFRAMMKIEEMAREPQAGPGNPGKILSLAVMVGVLAGLGCLTRYAFGWTIIPVAVFLVLFGGQRRALLAAVAFIAFAVVLTPWILRNEAVSGTLFGTAGYTVAEGSPFFGGFDLQRSINPDLENAYSIKAVLAKLLTNARQIFQNDLPKLGGSWAALLFLAGLLFGFRSQTARRLRYFLLMSLGTFVVFQALGKTQLSEEVPVINSENLLVLAVPLMFMFATVFFLTFLEQMKLPLPQLRYVIIGAFVVISSESLVASVAPPKPSPVSYPPYFPPDIIKINGWMKEDELTMSDVPWAVAWYGDRQCLWMTLDAKGDFFAVNDYLRPVKGIYFSTETMDEKFLSDVARSNHDSWEHLVLDILLDGLRRQRGGGAELDHLTLKGEETTDYFEGFPLRSSQVMFTGMFLTDHRRW